MIKEEHIVLVFLVSLGIFRVDFSGDFIGFELTPTLLISAVLNCYVLVKSIKEKKVKIIPELSVLLVIYLTYILIKCIVIPDVGLYSRIVLFFYVVITCYNFAILYKKLMYRREVVLYKFIKYTTIIYGIFSIIQLFLFIQGGIYSDNSNAFFRLYPQTISYFLPRLTGGFIDPNVCGFFFTLLYLVSYEISSNRIKKYRRVFGVIIILTLSRSAIATFIGIVFIKKFWDVILVKVQAGRFIKWKLLLSIGVVSFGFIYLISTVLTYIDLSLIIKGLQTRLLDPGSTDHHFLLVKYGKELIVENWDSLLFGHGFMSGGYYASDFYGGDKYANFHSEYITYLIEVGLVGLLLHFLVLYYPLAAKVRLFLNTDFILILLFSIAIALQNVFYQQYLFFYYWSFIFMKYVQLKQDIIRNE